MLKIFATLKDSGVFGGLAQTNGPQVKAERIFGGVSWDLLSAQAGVSVSGASGLRGYGSTARLGSAHHLTQRVRAIVDTMSARTHASPWAGTTHKLPGVSSKVARLVETLDGSTGPTDAWRSVLVRSVSAILRDLDKPGTLRAASSAGAIMRTATNWKPAAYDAQLKCFRHAPFDPAAGAPRSTLVSRAGLSRVTGLKDPSATTNPPLATGAAVTERSPKILTPEQEDPNRAADVKDFVALPEPTLPAALGLRGAWKLFGFVELWLRQLDEGPLIVQIFYRSLGKVVVAVIGGVIGGVVLFLIEHF